VKDPAETFLLDALGLVETRFDTKVKFLYVKAYVTGQDFEKWREIYKQHLWVFNRFEEREPYRESFEDFEVAFQEMINAFKQKRFDWERSPVPVVSGYPVNGAHRVACALFFGEQVLCYEDDRERFLYDEGFFLDLGLDDVILGLVCSEFDYVFKR
jgi:hypothetical protein